MRAFHRYKRGPKRAPNCEWRDFCPLHGRLVREEPPVDPPILFLVGEAPGFDEDLTGRPFVGKSGSELDMYLARFARVPRPRCYITNAVKCRPPDNRDPKSDELATCTSAWLEEELATIPRELVVAVGRVAACWLLDAPVSLERIHGIPQPSRWGVVMPIYHPAYGIHSPRRMRDIIGDFRAIGELVRGRSVWERAELPLDYALEGAGHGTA